MPVTKITRPILHSVFPRERLFRRLDDCNRQVIWITGPAGSGKTTVMSSYIDTRALPCLWYQFYEEDTDPATFFHYMGQAAKSAFSSKQFTLPAFTPECLLSIRACARRYFEIFFSCSKSPLVMVFDDYQHLPPESVLHDIVCEMLHSIPEGIRVCVMSREAPPAVMARLLANRKIDLLGWRDLRFTLEEIQGLLEFRNEKSLPAGAAEKLDKITEGWIAGLILILETAKSEGIEPQLLDRYTPAEIFDYFAGELFNKAEKEKRDLLTKTAFLTAVTPEAAEELTGFSDASGILSALSRKSYFIERCHTPELTYKYHHLFREFLMSRAQSDLSQAEIRRIQIATAGILEGCGKTEEAVKLCQNASAWDVLIGLILKEAPRLIAQGKNETLERWLRSIPQSVSCDNSWLSYWVGACMLLTDPVNARNCLEKAYKQFKAGKDIRGILLSWSGVVDSYMYAGNSIAPLDFWIEELEDLVSRFPGIHAQAEGRCISSIFFALSRRQPTHDGIVRWEQKALSLMRKDVPPVQQIMIGIWLIAYYLSTRGDLAKAAELADYLSTLTYGSEISPLARIAQKTMHAFCSWTRAEYDAGQSHAEEALTVARDSGLRVWDYNILASAIYSTLGARNLELAGKYFEKMASVLNTNSTDNVRQYYYLLAWKYWLTGDLPQALELAGRAVQLAEEVGMPFSEALTHIGLANVLFDWGDYQTARLEILRARETNRRAGSCVIEYKCLMAESYFALVQGREDEALESLRGAMALGRAKGFATFDFWNPPAVALLCLKALEEGIEVDHVQAIVQKLKLTPESSSLDCENWPWPVKIFTLGRFSLAKSGKPVNFGGRSQAKPLEMLKILVALGGREIAYVRIADVLWPEAEGDMAKQSFTTTLHRLRQLTGCQDALNLRGSKAGVDGRFCWVDCWAFERLAGQGEAAFSEGKKDKAVKLLERAISYYHGPFLPEDVDKEWSVSPRERLRSKFVRVVRILANHFEESGQMEKAVTCLQKGIETYDLGEELYEHLMLCLMRLDRRTEALAVYDRCKNVFAARLGTTPSSKIEDIIKPLLPERRLSIVPGSKEESPNCN